MGDLADFVSGAKPQSVVDDPNDRPPPPPPAGSLSAFVDDESSRLATAVKAGADTAPGQAAKILDLRDKTGLPTSLISRDPTAVDKIQKPQAIPLDFQNNHPAVSDWLAEDPHHAAVAGNDIPALGFLEREFSYMGNQAERGWFDIERSYLGTKAFFGAHGPADQKRIDAIEKRLGTDLNEPAPGPVSNVIGKAVEAVPQMAGILGLGAAAVAAGVSATLPAAVAFGSMELGNAYLDYRSRKDKEGNPISEAEARGWALVSGVLNGAAAMVPVGKMMEKIPGLKMLGREGIGAMISSQTVRAALGPLIRDIGETALTMGGYNTFGSLVHSASGKLAEMQNDKSFHTMSPAQIISTIFSKESLKEAAESGGSGLLTGALFGGAFGALGLYQNFRRPNLTRDSWQKVGQAIQNTEMAKTAPEQMEKVIERVAPDQKVYIPVEQWQTYWQGQKTDPRAAFKEVAGDTAAYDESLRTGADLQIPASKYAVKIAPSEHNGFFSNEVRSDPLEMNARETQDFLKASLEEQAKAKPTEGPAEESVAKVRQNVTEQLKQAGFDERTAQTYAKVYESTFKTMAQRAGVDPLELYQRYGLQIAKRETPVDDVSKMAEALRAREMERFTASKEEFGRWKGVLGLRMKPPAEVGGETDVRGEYGTLPAWMKNKAGLGNDEIAESARKAGLLGENEDLFERLRNLRAPTEPGPLADFTAAAQRQIESQFQGRFNQGVAAPAAAQALEKRAVDYFGTTEDIKEAGFILPNGKMIDLSGGKKGLRSFVHEKVMSALTPEQVAEIPSEMHARDYFLQNTGAMRVGQYGDKWIAESFATPTDEQVRQLAESVEMNQPKKIQLDLVGRRYEELQNPTAEDINRFYKGTSLFQASDEGTRGMMHFGPERQFNIDLLKNADLSTFLHETGHFYLEMMGDLAKEEKANPDIKADYQKILDYLGVKEGKIETEHHETFAKAFEAYLMEGKAPSEELRAPFARFRAWLLGIYQQVRGLNVNLTPEVRDVFDRMLASKEEVDAAHRSQGIEPLFKDPQAVGMNDKEAASYSKAIQEARASSEEDLMNRVLQERRRLLGKERDSVVDEFTNQANQMKEYIAQSVLKRGKLPDGKELPEGMSPVKLSKSAILNDYPDLKVEDFRGLYSAKEGIHPDQAAALFGFSSGDQMLRNLRGLGSKEDFVKRLADDEMARRHGDSISDGTLAEKAMDAVHNEKRSQMLHKELAYLASDHLAQFKGLIRKVTRRIPRLEDFQSQAEDLVGAQKVGDIRPSLYQRAEAASGREAVNSLLRGDIDSAFESKQRELLNHELYRAAQDAKEGAQSDVEFASKFTKDSIRAKLGKAGGEYLNQIDSLMERFDFSRITNKAVGERKSLREFVDSMKEAGYAPAIPEELLNDAYRKSWKEMSADDLRGVVDSMRAINHLAGLKNKLLTIQKGREFDEVTGGINQAIQEKFKLDPQKLTPPIDLHPSWREKIGRDISTFAAWRTKMEFLFRFLDGGAYHGPVWETFFNPVNEAENAKTARMNEAYGTLNDIFKDYSRPERAKFYSRLTHITEIGMDMNKMDMLMTLLHWGNEGNRAELLRGYKWNEGQVRAIWSHLDPRDFQIAQKIWDHIDSYWSEVSKQERELNGIAPEKVQASPFDVTLKDGSVVNLKGGYFPLVYDKNISWKAAVLGENEMGKDLFASQGGRAATKHGWTNERVGGGGMAPSLNFGTYINHVGDVIHDLAYRKPVIDLYKLINDDGIKDNIQAAAGKAFYKQLNPWLKRIAGDRPWNPLGPLEALNSGRANMTAAELGIKFTSAAIHSTSFLTAARELGLKYSLLGLKDSANIMDAWNFAKEKSEFMRSRPYNFDRDIRAAGKDLNIAGVSDSWLSELKAYSPIKRSAFWGVMRAFDLGVAIPTWTGAFRKAMEGGVKNIEAGDEKEAVEYADQLVRDTKGSGAAKDLAPIQNAGGPLGKLFTMFYTQLNVIDNQFMEAKREFRLDRNFPKLMATASLVWFAQAPLVELLRGKTPGDDEGWGKWLAKAELLYPANMIPGLREAVSYWQRGDLEASPVFEAIKTMLKTSKDVAQTIPGLKELAGEKEEWTDRDYADALMSVGYLTGLPTRQAIRTSQYLYDWMTGVEQPSNPFEGLWRTAVGRKAKQQ